MVGKVAPLRDDYRAHVGHSRNKGEHSLQLVQHLVDCRSLKRDPAADGAGRVQDASPGIFNHQWKLAQQVVIRSDQFSYGKQHSRNDQGNRSPTQR